MDEIALPQAGRKAHIGPYGHVGGLPGGQHKGRAGLQRVAQDIGAAEGDGAFRRRFASLHTAAQPQTRLDGAAVRSGQKAQAGEVQPGRAGFVRVGGVRQKGAQPGRERGHGITGARAQHHAAGRVKRFICEGRRAVQQEKRVGKRLFHQRRVLHAKRVPEQGAEGGGTAVQRIGEVKGTARILGPAVQLVRPAFEQAGQARPQAGMPGVRQLPQRRRGARGKHHDDRIRARRGL